MALLERFHGQYHVRRAILYQQDVDRNFVVLHVKIIE